jgi:hypothetical protein
MRTSGLEVCKLKNLERDKKTRQKMKNYLKYKKGGERYLITISNESNRSENLKNTFCFMYTKIGSVVLYVVW